MLQEKSIASLAEELKTTGQVVGFVDIGTNAIRLLVVRINPNLSYTTVSQEKEVVRSETECGIHEAGHPGRCAVGRGGIEADAPDRSDEKALGLHQKE